MLAEWLLEAQLVPYVPWHRLDFNLQQANGNGNVTLAPSK